MKTHLDIDDVEIIIEKPVPAPGENWRDVLRFAAASSCIECSDAGDQALVYNANQLDGGLGYTQKRGTYSAPEENRRYGLAVIRKTEGGDEMEIARGDLDTIMALGGVLPGEAKKMHRSLRFFRRSGFRAVAIATRPPGGNWRFRGFVPMIAMRLVKRIDKARAQFRYFPLWDWQLRIVHWCWVLCILGLAASGICIAEGWFLKRGDLTSGFQFGDIRFIHYGLAWILVAVMTLRFALFFFASNKYQRWGSLFPIRKQNWIDLYHVGKDYLLARSFDGPRYIGHNPLQQWSYTAIYGLFTIMIVSGFALYALYEPTQWFYQWFMPINDVVTIPYVRLIHLIGMWCFLIFATIHVYLSILAGNVDRDGTISSMFSGGRWVRKGVKFQDE